MDEDEPKYDEKRQRKYEQSYAMLKYELSRKDALDSLDLDMPDYYRTSPERYSLKLRESGVYKVLAAGCQTLVNELNNDLKQKIKKERW